jgi:2-alkenal reductase
MRSRGSVLGVIGGCRVIVLLALIIVPLLIVFSGMSLAGSWGPNVGNETPTAQNAVAVQAAATFTAVPTEAAPATEPAPADADVASEPALVGLYQQVNPGVVNIGVFVNQGGQAGQGAGSGFVLDDQGHVVTNNHVVADASAVFVTFWDGSEAPAEVVGTDPDSDLAVLLVKDMPEGVHSLPLGDSDAVAVGEWVAAIGNPFAIGTSMSVGIVSATGRMIASGATPFSIPEAIQTDAAINPGNSGGPLLNLNGEVVGVNAQIATGGTANASTGVGFAIPSNVVRRVAPALIEAGRYEWPWLGITGESVNLLLAQANDLPDQHGAYLHEIVTGGPADKAGLHGSTRTDVVSGVDVPVGGDVVVAADGEPVNTFTDLLVITSQHQPGDSLTLTVLRGGQRQDVAVALEPRPEE